MIRVILLYSAEYRFFVGFTLEIGIYVAGAAWAIQHYAKDFRMFRKLLAQPRQSLR